MTEWLKPTKERSEGVVTYKDRYDTGRVVHHGKPTLVDFLPQGIVRGKGEEFDSEHITNGAD